MILFQNKILNQSQFNRVKVIYFKITTIYKIQIPSGLKNQK